MRNTKYNEGFTLVELLAVIVVLAVIMVIAGTSILRVINRNNADAFVSTAQMAYDTLKKCKASKLERTDCENMIEGPGTDYTISVDLEAGIYTYTLTATTGANGGKFKNVEANLKEYYGNNAKTECDMDKIKNAGVIECSGSTIKGSY